MTRAPKKTGAPPDEFPRKAIPVASGRSPDEKGRSYAKVLISPEVAAYRVIGMMQPKNLKDDIDTPTLLATLIDQAKAVHGGDLGSAEAMLINQASALQALFVRLSERAMEQAHMPNLEGFMRLALRAQSQCRATLETLATIKNPPVVYARQANVTTGPQQNNFGVARGENEIKQTQQSEATDELLPDARAQGNACGDDQTLEALGEVDRAEVARG